MDLKNLDTKTKAALAVAVVLMLIGIFLGIRGCVATPQEEAPQIEVEETSVETTSNETEEVQSLEAPNTQEASLPGSEKDPKDAKEISDNNAIIGTLKGATWVSQNYDSTLTFYNTKYYEKSLEEDLEERWNYQVVKALETKEGNLIIYLQITEYDYVDSDPEIIRIECKSSNKGEDVFELKSDKFSFEKNYFANFGDYVNS